jgi:hypothetical protein
LIWTSRAWRASEWVASSSPISSKWLTSERPSSNPEWRDEDFEAVISGGRDV